MKRVQMTSLAAGPEGVLPAGAAVDLPDDQAAEMIAGGYAVEIPSPSAETATVAPAETTAAPPVQTAIAPPANAPVPDEPAA